MNAMFSGCTKLEAVTWAERNSKAQKGNSESMLNLFYNCSSLEYPKVEQLDTSSVTIMGSMAVHPLKSLISAISIQAVLQA